MITIRPMLASDLSGVRPLAEQLGYSCSLSELEARFELLLGGSNDPPQTTMPRRHHPDHQLFVAVAPDEIQTLGWIHVYLKLSLLGEPHAEVGGLVVDEKNRGQGIGESLMAEAERWAQERGLRVLGLSSQVKRERAHRFYERLGYAIEKTSHVLRKELPSSPS